MADQEKTIKKISDHIQKNLRSNTPFRTTQDFILYIAYKEARKQKELNTSKN